MAAINKFTQALLFFVMLWLWNTKANAQDSHQLRFQTSDGFYGTLQITTKPNEMGYGYVVFRAGNLTLEGVKGHSNVPGMSFPLTVNKFTVDLNGEACILLDRSYPDCGDFSVRSLSSTTSDYTGVNFSQDAKTRYDKLKENDSNISWQNDGYVSKLTVTDVNADVFRQINQAISEKEAASKNVSEGADGYANTDPKSANTQQNASSTSSQTTSSNSTANDSQGSQTTSYDQMQEQRQAAAAQRAEQERQKQAREWQVAAAGASALGAIADADGDPVMNHVAVLLGLGWTSSEEVADDFQSYSVSAMYQGKGKFLGYEIGLRYSDNYYYSSIGMPFGLGFGIGSPKAGMLLLGCIEVAVPLSAAEEYADIPSDDGPSNVSFGDVGAIFGLAGNFYFDLSDTTLLLRFSYNFSDAMLEEYNAGVEEDGGRFLPNPYPNMAISIGIGF